MEEYFETPHQVDIGQLGRLHHFDVFEANDVDSLQKCIPVFFSTREKPSLLVIQTPRLENGEILKGYFSYLKQTNQK